MIMLFSSIGFLGALSQQNLKGLFEYEGLVRRTVVF